MANRLMGALGRRLSARTAVKPITIRGQRPMVSFTFDDAPRSAATTGADLLQSAGATGTYYVAGGLSGGLEEGRPILSTDDLVRLNETGHELACHTFSHTKVSGLSSEGFAAETARNQAFVSEACGDVRLRNFSYPFGEVSVARKRQVTSMFASGRGIAPGVNHGRADLSLLKAVSLYSQSFDRDRVEHYLDVAGEVGGWLIFYTHDVEADPSVWGATPDHLEQVIRSTSSRGYDILTVRNAIGRLASTFF